MDDKRHLLFKLGISESDLGMLSRHSEGADQGPLTVSSGMLGHGRPDPGGVSYGDYQLTSQYIDAKGRVHPGQVREFLDSREGRPFKDHFKDERGHDLKPGSAAFTEAWKSVQDVEAFGQAQHAYIGSHFYNPQFDRACKAGIDADRCSDTLKNVIWSTAVQHGANSTVITDGLKAEAAERGKHVSALSDAECIKGIYQARAKANHNTPKLYSKEEGEALQMLKHEIEAKAHDAVSQRPASGLTHGGLAPTPHTLSTELSQRTDARTGHGPCEDRAGSRIDTHAPDPVDGAVRPGECRVVRRQRIDRPRPGCDARVRRLTQRLAHAGAWSETSGSRGWPAGKETARRRRLGEFQSAGDAADVSR
jgi:hypothetical protein